MIGEWDPRTRIRQVVDALAVRRASAGVPGSRIHREQRDARELLQTLDFVLLVRHETGLT